MNFKMARETGMIRYLAGRIGWRMIAGDAAAAVTYELPCKAKIRLPSSSPFAADIYCTDGHVDWGSETLMLDYLRQRPAAAVAYDVGANMGYYSVLLATVCSQVVAFEPDPRNHSDLLGQGIPNLRLEKKAVSDQSGESQFDNSEASTVGHLASDRAGGGIRVETVSLDDFRESNPTTEPVAFVKMDIEGYEIPALQGATRLTAKERSVYLIEFALENGVPNSVEALEAFLLAHHYRAFAMVRYPAKPWKYRTVFQQLNTSDIARSEIKMIFLVPREDHFFEARAAAGFCFEQNRNQRGRVLR